MTPREYASIQPVDPDATTTACLLPSSERLKILLHLTTLNRHPHQGPCQLILTQFGPVSNSGMGAPWLRGLPRIPQQGALLLHANSFHPSIVPSFAASSFHFPVCGYLCSPLVKKTILFFGHIFPHPSPFIFLLLCRSSQFETSPHSVLFQNRIHINYWLTITLIQASIKPKHI